MIRDGLGFPRKMTSYNTLTGKIFMLIHVDGTAAISNSNCSFVVTGAAAKIHNAGAFLFRTYFNHS